MAKTNTILLSVLTVAVVLLGGGVIYILNKPSDNTQNTNDQQTSENSGSDPREVDADPAPTESDNRQVIDGVAIPDKIIADIERDYPDYIIEDADREVRDGVVYYEIELDHRDPANDSEYELTYSDNWELIEEDFDRD